MTFLYPAIFAGLLGLGLPVLIHMIARHRFPIHDFPATRLLQPERRVNVFALRIIDRKQLLLRLLVLLLLVLAMARLFSSFVPFGTPSRNVVFVLDASASMQQQVQNPQNRGEQLSLFTLAKRRAQNVLQDLEKPSRSGLVITPSPEDQTSKIPLDIDQPRVEERMAEAQVTDATGNVVGSVAEACEMLVGRNEAVSQIVVLTDARGSAFEKAERKALEKIEQAQQKMDEKLDIVIHNVSSEGRGNTAVVDARVRGGKTRVGDDAHVLGTVKNYGDEAAEIETRVDLAGSKIRNSKEITLGPQKKAVVDMTGRMERATSDFARFYFEGAEADTMRIDNAFALPLIAARPIRAVVVRAGEDELKKRQAGAKLDTLAKSEAEPEEKEESSQEEGRLRAHRILRYALNPGQELPQGYESAVRVKSVTPSAMETATLSKYDIVFLTNISSVSEQLRKDLRTFVARGNSLVIIAGSGVNAADFNNNFASGNEEKPPLAPASIANLKEQDPPKGIDTAEFSHPVLEGFRDPRMGNLSVVRFRKLRKVREPASGAEVMFRTSGGSSLAMEQKIENGRVVLFAFGLRRTCSNLALSRVFPVFMKRMVAYLSGELEERPPDILPAMRESVLDVSETQFAFTDELELSKVDQEKSLQRVAKLDIQEGDKVVIPPSPAGRYKLHKPLDKGASVDRVSYARNITVVQDSRESDMAKVSAAHLEECFGEYEQIQDKKKLAKLVPEGKELWLLLVFLLVIAYVVEAFRGWYVGLRRERERLEEGAVETESASEESSG